MSLGSKVLMQNISVKLGNISKSYPQFEGAEQNWILRDLSLEIESGASVAVVGPSGSGKSTLLNIVGALDTPDSGTVEVNGESLAGLSETELASKRATCIGIVFQLHHLLPQCTVLENALLPSLASAAKAEPGAAHERATALLKRIGLEHRLNHHPGQLSGGERQRVAVVRALINRPSILLADEPTGSLDRKAAAGLADLLVELNTEDGISLITVTHSNELAERMQQTYELVDGRLEQR